MEEACSGSILCTPRQPYIGVNPAGCRRILQVRLCSQVCQPQPAQAFCNGMEYFNTFGGCTAAGAAGLAVLAALREEGLQQNAQAVGLHLLAGLRALQTVCPVLRMTGPGCRSRTWHHSPEVSAQGGDCWALNEAAGVGSRGVDGAGGQRTERSCGQKLRRTRSQAGGDG